MNGKHADVVVACLVAGVGAWATEVTVAPAPAYTYASELFGPGHDTLEYPDGNAPVVTLTIPGNTPGDPNASPPVAAGTMGNDHNGEAVIIFMLTGGVFDTNIDRLMWDADGPEMHGDGGDADVLCGADADNDVGCDASVPAPGTVASIMSGGEKGENSITIKIEAGQGDVDVDGETDADKRNAGVTQMISFKLPELNGLEDHLGGATAGKPKTVKLMATSRIVSGAFSDGPLITKTVAGQKVPDGRDVVTAVNAVSVAIKGVDKHDIAIDDSKDGSMKAFQHVLGAKNSFVKLADVMIETLQKHEISKEVKATPAKAMYTIRGDLEAGAGADDDAIFSLPSPGMLANAPTIHDLDGKPIDAGLRGTLTITAEGSRGLFNDGDMMFIDYDGDGMAGDSEEIDTDGKLAEGTALSIDPDDSDSFNGGTGTFSVYYMAGGKDHINHGSTIEVTASVDYSDPSARDETDVMSTTTLNFDGVGNPVMAYAIPHSTNEMGDKGNVRVRCEDSTDCRVFLECWGDDGTETRGFGEVLGGVPADGVEVWNGAAIESVTGRMPDSRHSCRVLSKGDVTVQQLTRDGHSNTLVNNTYVAD